MKKIILGIVIVLIVFFVYEYQKPLKTSDVIVKQAIQCVNHPPEKLHIRYSTSPNLTLKDIQNWQTDLVEKGGFYNDLTNKREWRVTFIINKAHTTVKLNAYNGKCLAIYPPLS